jgi:lipopolysaccharide/colanic/teichoic acid biosynthesis glycosyltransferase
VADAPARGPGLTIGADPRVTRVGRWLRRTKIDELAQLLDVLAGQMSLVGPRPELPRYVALYPPLLRDQLLGVRPGITDPASLKYADEASLLAAAADPEREYTQVLLPAKLQASADYLRSATLASDMAVLARTAALLFGRRR